ncbi:alpha/beta hydrolase [Herbiconiux daphne]|uniref:Lysophospholipase n=1 Tax=Herbiconiux daphne TaxID=2970914 RepID=A0ABT2H2I3_9MICO|nr:lysophospholipase [Herbiconiux daphne]MCS5734161.1 lysophospholipase [Herbiconiux daphne]
MSETNARAERRPARGADVSADVNSNPQSTDPWVNPTAALRGSIVVLAGRGESAAVYERFSNRLAYDGYRVTVVPDSSRDVDATARDAARLLADRGDVPSVLIGSDTGAAVAAVLLAQGRVFADVAVLAGLPAADSARSLDWEAELEVRSACPVHRGALARDGAVEHGALARRDAVVEGVDARVAGGILVPVLTVHGGADALSDVETALALYRAIPDAESYVIEAGRHDILNDVTHRSVAATIVLFLERLRTPGRTRVVVPATEVLAGAA